MLIGASNVQAANRPAEVHVRTELDLRDWLCRQQDRDPADRSELDRVAEEVADDLLEPNGIPAHLRRAGTIILERKQQPLLRRGG